MRGTRCLPVSLLISKISRNLPISTTWRGVVSAKIFNQERKIIRNVNKVFSYLPSLLTFTNFPWHLGSGITRWINNELSSSSNFDDALWNCYMNKLLLFVKYDKCDSTYSLTISLIKPKHLTVTQSTLGDDRVVLTSFFQIFYVTIVFPQIVPW